MSAAYSKTRRSEKESTVFPEALGRSIAFVGLAISFLLALWFGFVVTGAVMTLDIGRLKYSEFILSCVGFILFSTAVWLCFRYLVEGFGAAKRRCLEKEGRQS